MPADVRWDLTWRVKG